MKATIDVVIHRGDTSLTPLNMHDKRSLDGAVCRTELYPSRHNPTAIKTIDVHFNLGLYQSVVFFEHNDGRCLCVATFTAVHDGTWKEVKFLRDGEIWIIEYRTRIHDEEPKS